MAPINVLLVDDDPDIARLMIHKISREAPNFTIEFVEGGQECLNYIEANKVDCILSDYQMPGMNGMELLMAVRRRNDNTPFIFITGQGNEEIAREAFVNGADDYFTKDIGFAHFTRIINSIERGVNRRISDEQREHTERRLRESERMFRTLFESANDAILLMDGHTFTDCNSMALKVYGCDAKDELVGRTPMDFSPETQPDGRDSRDAALKYVAEAQAGKPQRFYWKHTKKDGSQIDVDVSLNSLKLNGHAYLQAIVRDITEQKKAEDALRASQNFLETIIETEPECVKLLSPEGKLLMMNRAGLDMIQAESLEQVQNKPALNLVVPEHREAFINLSKNIMSGGSGTLEFDMTGLGGKRLKLETHMVPLRNEKEEIIAILGVTRDITDKKRAEDELMEKEERFRAIFNSVSDSVIIHDFETGAIQDVNKRMCDMLGYTYEEALKLSVDDISSGTPPYTGEEAHHWMNKATSGKTQRFKWRAKAKDGRLFWVEISLSLATIGGKMHILATSHELTEAEADCA